MISKTKTHLPSEEYRDNPSTILSNLQESRLSQIEVFERRIAPPAIVIGQSLIRWAEVGGRDNDVTMEAPFGVVVASHLVTCSTAQTTVEESSAQSRRASTVPLAVQVSITTRTSCINFSTTISVTCTYENTYI